MMAKPRVLIYNFCFRRPFLALLVREDPELFARDVLAGAHTGSVGLQREDVAFLDAVSLREGSWIDWGGAEASSPGGLGQLLLIPGGFDLGYCKKLDGDGVGIRGFVEGGGSLLGLCAGSYFASRLCKFDLHNWAAQDRRIVGARELALFPGTAEGPWLGDYAYTGDHTTGRVARIVVSRELEMPLRERGSGTRAMSPDAPGQQPSAGGRSIDLGPRSTGAARRVGALVEQVCADCRRDVSTSVVDEEVLGVYWNGGPRYILDQEYPASAQVLACYADAPLPGWPSREAAVVEVRVGQGRAILSAVHPEISKAYLQRQRSCTAGQDTAPACAQVSSHVLSRLDEQDSRRFLGALVSRLLRNK
ncbi:unnamed protein product [Prorocentrum cordatum]|uniref:Biotin-protein ligase N-terminal domain-containing protein n=1 Tax=Prorocentrum cordatum TaxID=2364126 RepID=A0ABN9W3R1_9DINO|nr:unnamed protein product [Polarella glacialis]